ncbi:MAG: hypothetical protein AAF756_01595 [Pseudomonadota bacterium]
MGPYKISVTRFCGLRAASHSLAITACIALISPQLMAQSSPIDFGAIEYRNVGPARGGRVTSVAGTRAEPGTFFLGASGGGVWKTTDYGTSWSNVSDGFFTTPSVGDIAISMDDPNIVYVGTGSDGLRSNVIPGDGVYKSIDGGESWKKVGLEQTGHIGAVEIDPRSNNIAWVAAIGNAFKSNSERGVFKTEDGGASWEKVLYLSDTVGFSDIELLPHNPDVVFATAWKAERKPWTIISGGNADESGLFKSEDGGKSWRKITEGLPTDMLGKIDIAVSPADSSVVYLLLEAPGDEGGVYRSDDQGESFRQVSSKRGLRTRPFYYTNIEADPKNADRLYVMATRYFRSEDGGKTWERRSSPHGDNHDMWINPDNPKLFVQGNDGGANVTHNGGETWSSQFNQPTTEFYQVEVDDQYPYWLYGGQQDNYSTLAVPSRAPRGVQRREGWLIETGGCETGPAVPKPGQANIVYANCKGRFGVFDKTTGTERSYYVGAANMYGQNPKDLRYRFQRVAPIHVSPHDPNTVYHASQFVHRTQDEGETWEVISPDLTAFEEHSQVISGAPITRDITGEEFHSTIYSLRESPVDQGLLWVGANDGPIHISRDGGENWSDVTPRMPTGGRVDSIEPSPHDPAKAYAAILRYQLGDDRPYIYRTENFGESWTLLTDGENGIPADAPTRVVREDPVRPGLLFAGTDVGVFVSFDDGERWQPFQQNLPLTQVSDLKLHRDDLVVSTMGRGFWVADKIATLRDSRLLKESEVPELYAPADTIRYRQNFRIGDDPADPDYPAPAVYIDYRLPAGSSDPVTLEIFDAIGDRVNGYTVKRDKENTEGEGSAQAGQGATAEQDMALSATQFFETSDLKSGPGLHRFAWDMRYRGAWHKEEDRRYKNGPLVSPGRYIVRLGVGEEQFEQSFDVLVDPRVKAQGVSQDDIEMQLALQREVLSLIDEARRMVPRLEEARSSLSDDEAVELKDAAMENTSEGDESDHAETATPPFDTALELLETQEGTYMPPRLIDQLSYLYFMLSRADQRPGRDAFERRTELSNQLAGVRDMVDDSLEQPLQAKAPGSQQQKSVGKRNSQNTNVSGSAGVSANVSEVIQ